MIAFADSIRGYENDQNTEWLLESLGTLDKSAFSYRSLIPERVDISREQGSLVEAWRDPKAQELLRQLFYKGMFCHQKEIADSFCEAIEHASDVDLSDEVLFAVLREFVSQSVSSNDIKEAYRNDEAERVERRVTQLVETLSPPARLVDVGSGDAKIAAMLAQKWQKQGTEVIALDVEDRPERNNDIQFRKINDGKVPVDLRSDAALLLMVLHHEAHPERLLSEVYKMLEPGGVALLRETDVHTPSEERFHAALDYLYFKVLNDLPGVPVPAMYRSLESWGKLAVDTGFRVEKVIHPEPLSPVKPFHMLLRKEGG